MLTLDMQCARCRPVCTVCTVCNQQGCGEVEPRMLPCCLISFPASMATCPSHLTSNNLNHLAAVFQLERMIPHKQSTAPSYHDPSIRLSAPRDSSPVSTGRQLLDLVARAIRSAHQTKCQNHFHYEVADFSVSRRTRREPSHGVTHHFGFHHPTRQPSSWPTNNANSSNSSWATNSRVP